MVWNKKMKFIEMTNQITEKLFHVEQYVGNDTEKLSITLELQSLIDLAISKAIPQTLCIMMKRSRTNEASITVGPFTFGVTNHRSNGKTSFVHTFKLNKRTKFFSTLDDYQESLYKNISTIEKIADSIDDELFIDTVKHQCMLDSYNQVKDSWTMKRDEKKRGAEIDNISAQLFVAAHVCSIVYALANIKSEGIQSSYSVPTEGVYVIGQIENKWGVNFLPSRSFERIIENYKPIDLEL
jgi:hypothetical protein